MKGPTSLGCRHSRRGVLFAALLLTGTVSFASPPVPDPNAALAVRIEAEDPQSLPQLGAPFDVYLEFVRQPGTDEVTLALRSIDARVEVDQTQPNPPITFLEASSAWDLYSIDVTSLPEEVPSQVYFTFTPVGEAGAGMSALVWDATGGSDEAWLNFPVDEFGVVQPRASAGEIGAAQLARFASADQWAKQQVQLEETLPWVPSTQEPDIYQATDRRTRHYVRWPSTGFDVRRLSRRIHRDWDRGRDRGTGVRFSGRLAFRDDAGCNPPTGAHMVSWTDCHAFKGRMDSSGAAFTDNVQLQPAYRPLPGTLAIEYEVWRDGILEKLCDLTTFQVNASGRFHGELLPCNVAPGGDLEYRVIGTLILDSQVYGLPDDPLDETGYVRGAWPVSTMRTLFPPSPSGAVVRWNEFDVPNGDGSSTRHAIPALQFTHAFGGPEPVGGLVQMGMRILASDRIASYNYLRNVLSAYTTMVQLHHRLQILLAPEIYLKMFRHPGFGGRANRRNYMVWFNSNAGAFGWAGGISLLAPQVTVTESLLSETGVLAHEFAHSVHNAIAPQSIDGTYDYDFADSMMLPPGSMNPRGPVYTWGHGPGQYQELGAAFVEGVAAGLGQYMLNECRNSIPARRTIGSVAPSFAFNMWSGAGPDVMNTMLAPSIHHYRWFMNNRTTAREGSATYTERLARLRGLTNTTFANGHTIVKTNDEGRIGMWLCDLLDADSDISYVAALSPPLTSYSVDFTHDAWRVMSGVARNSSPTRIEPWQGPAGPETIQLDVDEFLDSLANFCPTCPEATPGSEYGPARLSTTTGRQSPQALAKFLSAAGLTTPDAVRDSLRANFMETYGLP